jgi:hypothetical protein
MMKRITLNVYNDPGHGWAKVSINTLKKLGLINQISHYSYINNNHAYLEEDCDLGLLLDTLEKLNIKWQLKHHQANKTSKIRNYDYYSRDKAMNNYLSNLYNHLTS